MKFYKKFIYFKKSILKKLKLLIPYSIMISMQKKEKKEKYITCGNLYPKKYFYIIRIAPRGAGLFSNFHWVLGHIIYAIEKKYIPIIDMQNYKTYYNENMPINGTNNAWEYYFRQPTSYTLEQAYKSKNVILAKMEYLFKEIPFFYENEEQIKRFNKYISSYIQFNEITLKNIEKSRSNLFYGKNNILGILYRGTDYIGLKPTGHSIIASIDEYINKTYKYIDKWNMDYVYLETEDMNALKIFKKEFNNKLIISDSQRIENYTPKMKRVPSIVSARKNDNYLKGLEYIVDTVLLSLCDSIIAPKVNGTMAALAFNNNKYKYKYIFSLGTYP